MEKGNNHNSGDIEMLIRLSEIAAERLSSNIEPLTSEETDLTLAAKIMTVTKRLKREHGIS